MPVFALCAGSQCINSACEEHARKLSSRIIGSRIVPNELCVSPPFAGLAVCPILADPNRNTCTHVFSKVLDNFTLISHLSRHVSQQVGGYIKLHLEVVFIQEPAVGDPAAVPSTGAPHPPPPHPEPSPSPPPTSLRRLHASVVLGLSPRVSRRYVATAHAPGCPQFCFCWGSGRDGGG